MWGSTGYAPVALGDDDDGLDNFQSAPAAPPPSKYSRSMSMPPAPSVPAAVDDWSSFQVGVGGGNAPQRLGGR